MELAELMSLRPVPAAGLLMTVTGRCPLRCAHCSTGSTMASGEPDAGALLRFVGSFDAARRPSVLMLTGGEPLLRPALTARLAARARAVGTRTALLTGAFFAARRGGGRTGAAGAVVPRAVLRAVEAVDHFSVSVDVHHEREVPRADAFAAVREVLDAGIACSFHVVGDGPDDPYLADVTADIRRSFDDRVPVLVNSLRAVGRAASWAAARDTAPPAPGGVLPCAMAAWPVVAADGTVLACCNQDVVDLRPAPAHLRVGHVAEDDWADVARRVRSAPVLRMIRAAGPGHLRDRYATGDGGPRPGYCAGCRTLGEHPEVLAAAERLAGGPAGALLDLHVTGRQTAAGPAAFVRRHGSPAHADLVMLPGDRR
ncbi:radical SAM protein [Streptomyces sp. NPDC026672]|uniref:radical SAM protein n=1 Tax=unclassified Streptomyces TaxID=2593676 RepID=UPI0033C8AD37